MHMYIVNSMKKTNYIRHFPCGMQCPNINPCIPLVRLASIFSPVTLWNSCYRTFNKKENLSVNL